MRAVSKKNSIYVQLLRLLILSAAAALVCYGALNYAGHQFVAWYYRASDYERNRNTAYIEKLQQYVDGNRLFTWNIGALSRWADENPSISFTIYKNGSLVYDSMFSDLEEQEAFYEELAEDEGAYADEIYEESTDVQEMYYSVKFRDGMARINIMGWYTYHLYNYAVVAEIILSFAFFLLIVLLGIRRKVDYILTLSEEIGILEGGGLDYEITVKGKDELASLARGLDNMRLSFGDMMRRETEMVRENQRIITEMSHDLRTPVTSIMLYTEILKTGRYKDEKQLLEQLEKIDGKARRMKQLTDHLFEYTLVSGREPVVLESPQSYKEIFYDLLSEMCGFLAQRGFATEQQIDWREDKIRIYTEYVMRVTDNITSNILKYADAKKPVRMESVCVESRIGFAFENVKRELEEKEDSSGVGLQSIRNMMEKMGGTCAVYQDEERFRIEIMFPCAASENEDPSAP